MKKIVTQSLLYLALFIFVIIWVAPLVQMVLASFMENSELRGSPWHLPANPNLNAFIDAWKVLKFDHYFKNSAIVTVFSTLLCLILSSLAAYGLSIKRVPGNKIIYPIMLACMIVPAQILLVPLYQLLQDMHLISTYSGLILIHTAWNMPFGIFILYNFFKDVPKEILDAAKTDGCSDMGIFWRIMMPLSKPSLATLAIFTSTWVWNDFLFGLIFAQNDKIKPVTVGLMATEGRYLTLFNLQSAAGLLALIVPLLIFILFQRYFIKGLSAGALKG